MEAFMCGWTANDFWGATFGEIIALFRAYDKRCKHLHQLAAWHVAHVINLVAKSPVSVYRLLGQPEPFLGVDAFADASAFKRYLDERNEQLMEERLG